MVGVFDPASNCYKLQADMRYIAAIRTNAQKTQPPLLKCLCCGYHVIAIQPVHWRADCCLATSCNIRLLRTQLPLLHDGLFTELLPGNALIKSVTTFNTWGRLQHISYILLLVSDKDFSICTSWSINVKHFDATENEKNMWWKESVRITRFFTLLWKFSSLE
jgi:hypothetical protein